MYQLSNKELYKSIENARSIDENEGRKIIEEFQAHQPALAQTIFSIFPSFIAEKNQDMAHYFIDLCFDVIAIYQHAFGKAPDQNEEWIIKQSALLDAELQSLNPDNNIDPKIRKNLQERFYQRNADEVSQPGLIQFMNDSIDQFAVETSSKPESIKLTQTMIFVVIRLFNNLYKNK